VLGPVTLKAAQATNGLKVCVLFSAYRLDFLTNLPTWSAFGKGWSRRVASNLKQAAEDDK
jgi:lysozyme family protein